MHMIHMVALLPMNTTSSGYTSRARFYTNAHRTTHIPKKWGCFTHNFNDATPYREWPDWWAGWYAWSAVNLTSSRRTVGRISRETKPCCRRVNTTMLAWSALFVLRSLLALQIHARNKHSRPHHVHSPTDRLPGPHTHTNTYTHRTTPHQTTTTTPLPDPLLRAYTWVWGADLSGCCCRWIDRIDLCIALQCLGFLTCLYVLSLLLI